LVERVHVQRLIENSTLAGRYQILCLPGGFSYGDDIAAGRILAGQLRGHLSGMLQSFAEGDRLILGICNGFQVLLQLGVLTEGIAAGPVATLTHNVQGRFEDRWVHLRVPETPCVFLRGVERCELPVAHGEGRFVAASGAIREQLAEEGRLALRYAPPPDSLEEHDLEETLPFPLNPNGAEGNVAGVCDSSGRLFGLMPHPERHLDPTHHPKWTRRKSQPEWGDGFAIFRNGVEYFTCG
jgi:phosphoribosylformylglycinamidine synthase